WCGDVPLRRLYPNLFEKESEPFVVVANRMIGNYSDRIWNWRWSSNLTDTEMVEVETLQHLLFDVSISDGLEDKWSWIPEQMEKFSVKSSYVTLSSSRNSVDLNPSVLAALNELWVTNIPSKVSIFGWRLLLGKLPTKAALAHRGRSGNSCNYNYSNWCTNPLDCLSSI
ncbi:ribonuclease H protein, partial [Trifolium medium]|nr:ribonuclease H protein [Trifolium medium]